MLGQLAHVGSGVCDLLLDAEQLQHAVELEAPDADGQKRRFLGFLAQEVEDVLPELVSTDAEGTKSVNYVGVVPVLVEALKEERAARTALEARLDARAGDRQRRARLDRAQPRVDLSE
mgnify:CR=1 FL=1